ncbi:MAG: matrixin family metalloprotease [Methylococcaceae bacterium]
MNQNTSKKSNTASLVSAAVQQGTSGNDTLNGTSGADQLYGLAGNDYLAGDLGNDTLDGGTGNDSLWGDAGNDSLSGGDGDDYADGSDGNDTLNGGTGKDALWGGLGADSVFGGDGDDYLEGSNGANSDNSNDTLDGGIGNDSLYAGGGNDSLKGSDGFDQLFGEAGNDTLDGGTANDSLYGGFGADSVLGGDGNDYLDGSDGFNGETSNNTLSGGAGNDTLYGNNGSDTLSGDDGNDYLDGSDGVKADSRNNSLNGGTGNDTLYGSSGNDTLNGGTGKDTLSGGAGNDSYYIDNLNDTIVDTSGDDTAYISVNGYNLPTGIEHVSYATGVQALPYFIGSLDSRSHWGDLGQPKTLTYSFVTTANDNITPNIKGFMPYTDAQKTAVRQALAAYSAVAGLNFTESTDSTSVALRFFRDDLSSGGYSDSAGYTWFPTRGDVHIKNTYTDLSMGSYGFELLLHEIGHGLGLKHPFDDAPKLPSTEDNNINTVMSYTHTSPNYATVPRLFDMATIQYFYGVNHNYHTSNDTYHLTDRYIWDGSGLDTLTASEQTQAVSINLNAGSWNTIGSKASSILSAKQSFIGFDTQIETAIGGSGNDTLIGNSLANNLQGGSGNDTLNGSYGADTLNGGLGNDSYYVDNSADTIIESSTSKTEIDSVNSSVSYTLPATNVENLSLTGTTSINVTGNTLNNLLTGNSAANTLTGNLGADTLIGGLGKDTNILTESTASTDVVRISAGDSLVTAFDTVTGFKLAVGSSSVGIDKLDLPSTVIKANITAFNGIDSGVIHSSHIVNGLISFDDIDNYTSPLTITSTSLTNAISYLQSNITTVGNTVAFTALNNTYVFQDSGTNDSLIQLTGVSATNLTTTGLVSGGVWLV